MPASYDVLFQLSTSMYRSATVLQGYPSAQNLDG